MTTRHASLAVSVPRALRRFVDQRVRGGHFGDVSDYIRWLIRADQGAAAAGAPAQPMRGHGESSISTPGDAREGPTSATAVADFRAADWRELREGLLAGQQRLMARRIADIAPLWREALLVRRAGLRHEDPEATEEELDERLAAYVQDMSIEPEDPHLRPDPEWLQRILRG